MKAHLTWTVVHIVAEHVQLWLDVLAQRNFVQTHVLDCLVYLCLREGVSQVEELVVGGGEGGNITSTERLMSPHPEKCQE